MVHIYKAPEVKEAVELKFDNLEKIKEFVKPNVFTLYFDEDDTFFGIASSELKTCSLKFIGYASSNMRQTEDSRHSFSGYLIKSAGYILHVTDREIKTKEYLISDSPNFQPQVWTRYPEDKK